MNVIEINQISKTFGKGRRTVHAVASLDLAVSAGQVFGFLGPNGAGKSTTIRMMLGLIRPTNGTIKLFGENVQKNNAGLKNTGALVETAMFYPFLTGRDNLRALALHHQIRQNKRIDEVLSRVGMLTKANRKVSDYSTGMKQRLGIAAALLSNPDLIILDEPTNGLDPAGIIEIRRFIRSLAVDEGKTVFLSSHLLTEVEQVCDRVAIINQGRIVREGSIKALLVDKVAELRMEVSDREKALGLLQGSWEIRIMDKARWLSIRIAPEENPIIVRKLVENGIDVHQAIFEQQSLENLFLSLTHPEDLHD